MSYPTLSLAGQKREKKRIIKVPKCDGARARKKKGPHSLDFFPPRTQETRFGTLEFRVMSECAVVAKKEEDPIFGNVMCPGERKACLSVVAAAKLPTYT